MRVSSQKSGVFGGWLLTAIMACTPCNAAEVDAVGLPKDFLEYLGTLVDTEGEWVDALELNDGTLGDGDVQQAGEQENDDLRSTAKVSSTGDDKAEE